MGVVKLVRWIFAVTAVVLICGSYAWWRHSTDFIRDAVPAEGTVIDLVRSSSRSSERGTYRPVVRFRTQVGEEVEFVSNWSSYPPPYRRGDAVEVLYSPSDPRQASIRRFFALWGGPMIAGILGLVFTIVAVALFFIPTGPAAENGREPGGASPPSSL